MRFSHLAIGACAVVCSVAGHAQVIEIGDDGQARTYSAPTRFLGAGGDDGATPVADPDRSDRFDRAARSAGVDARLLRAVAWTESRGRQSALSVKGAVGTMQLMPGTAAELGVDARDADANINGGARYLARQLARFGTVPLALAAYNAGPGAVTRWGGIPPYAETRSYVASIMARWQPGTANAGRITMASEHPRREQSPLLIEVQ